MFRDILSGILQADPVEIFGISNEFCQSENYLSIKLSSSDGIYGQPQL